MLLSSLAALSLVTTLAACGGSSSSAGEDGASGENLEIGLMVWTSAPYYEVVIEGAKAEAKKLGAEIVVSNAQGSLQQEVALVQQYVTQQKDALILIASNSEGIVPAVKQANQADIPVIASQTAIAKSADTVAYVGADNVEYGRRLADATAEAIGDKGDVALILGQLGSSPQIDRRRGFIEQIEAKYPDIKLVAEQTASWDYNKALKVSQDFLNRYPKGDLAAIVDQGPEGVTGARYAQQNGRDEVKWIVGDVPKEVSTALENGTVDAAVYQNPYEQGVLAARDAVRAAQGKQVPDPHLTDILIVTNDNLDEIDPYTY